MDPKGRDEMLELARDLTHGKGMSLLFSSHLLPDVEFVCDYVMVLGRGKLLAQGKIADLKQTHDSIFQTRVKDGRDRLALRLTENGCTTTIVEDILEVTLPHGKTQTEIWRAAASEGLQIRHLRPRRSTLEEVFLKALEA
jgi:ABC-2 type transport system ATP-binding protein